MFSISKYLTSKAISFHTKIHHLFCVHDWVTNQIAATPHFHGIYTRICSECGKTYQTFVPFK